MYYVAFIYAVDDAADVPKVMEDQNVAGLIDVIVTKVRPNIVPESDG